MSPFFLQERFRHAIDKRRRWIVRNEALGKLQRNEVRGLRAGGQPVQQLQPFALALRFDLVPEHELGSRLVHARIELEASAFRRFVDGPSGKHLRGFGDVALRVAAIHAQGVQFQQFPSVIFVQATGTLARLRPLRRAARVGVKECCGIPIACAEFGPTLRKLSR